MQRLWRKDQAPSGRLLRLLFIWNRTVSIDPIPRAATGSLDEAATKDLRCRREEVQDIKLN